jgi:23S rRNA (cytidine2498-2'-O)-methyltransferase
MNQPRFYFSTCQVGAEKAVKAEIAKYYPELKFSFSRPGFITFKEDDDSKPLIKTPKSVFSRLWGVAVGQAKEKGAIKELIESVPADAPLHVFSRDEYIPGDEREDYKRDARIFGLLKEFGVGRSNNQTPKLNETVYDLIWIDDLHVFLGKHINDVSLDGSAGNIPKLVLPDASPSRAYLKIAEAVHRYKPEVRKGLQVLEVGCAPGGATTAMLSWGLNVVGVDPKRVDMRIQGNPHFQLIQKEARHVSAADLKANPEWLVLDMNIAPLEALDELAHVVALLRKNFGRTLLLGKGFLTIKLNDWKFADSIPLYLARIQEIGFKNLTVTQLVTNRQEFFVMANGFE